MKSVRFICGGRMVPASRFRVSPIALALEERGWDAETIYGYGALDQYFGSSMIRRGYRALCRLKRAARTATLVHDGPVMVQRLALPWVAFPEEMLARRNGQLVFDFDDAVFLDARGKASRSRSAALQAVFRAARHTVAGNSWLAEHVPEGCDVSVIPTCIDTRLYTPGGEPGGGRLPRIGWIGTGGNHKYLERLVAPIKQLRRDGYDFEFVICSDEKPGESLAGLEYRFIKWSQATEIDTLRSFDIGLMPLWDDDWCRGKCSFKAIQYMATGVPVVASAVGFNRDVVRDEVDGFLVERDAWLEPLAALLADAELRGRMGAKARERAVSEFDITRAVDSYEALFERIIRGG